MKYNLKKMLQKCVEQGEDYVLLIAGFNNNCNLAHNQIESLYKLAEEMKEDNLVIVFDSIAFTPYITSYNGSHVLAGIKFNKIENW